MKRMFLATSVALPCLIVAGLNCSADDSTFVPHPTTGTTDTSGAGNGNAGSTTSTGGSAGSTTTSTTTTTVATGGSGGSGGAGGNATGGSAGTAGTGGTAGNGGTGGGVDSGTEGGATGGGGSGGGGSICKAGDCSAVLKMDGAFNLDPPASVTGSDGIQGPGAKDGVPTAVCQPTETRPDHGLPLKELHWQLTGAGITTGTMYNVTVHFTGVLECKTYQNLNTCTRPTNQGRDAVYDMWCPAATDPPLTAQPDHYNTVMLSVTPTSSGTTPNIGPASGPMPTAGNWWMLNECPAGVTEYHLTWKVDYEKTILVPGGSWINFVEFDTNCREIINCGNSTDSAVTCTQHYSLTPPNPVPAPPQSITTQPAAPGGGGWGQWIFFDVKNIAPM